jgi:hypothetical protein
MFTTAGRQCSPVAPLTTIGQDYVARPMRQMPKTESGAEIGASKADTCNHTYTYKYPQEGQYPSEASCAHHQHIFPHSSL